MGPKGCTLYIRTRDFNSFSLVIQKERDAVQAFQTIQNLLTDSDEKIPALNQVPAEFDDGWDLYDPIAEFTRLGIGSKNTKWRVSNVNRSYSLCSTYPQILAVPSEISDTTLLQASRFRSRGRISILSYVHPRTGASITRCSQPLSGISGMQKRNSNDEELIRAIFASNEKYFEDKKIKKFNLILDARPKANAYANAAMGKGFESTEFYQNCEREFLGIENIHVMRDSITKMIDAINQPDQGYSTWSQNLESSSWLKHIKQVLDGTLRIVTAAAKDGANVLIHCSDGWDRTAQLTGLAQVLLDPYYRTFRGFMILIEKEWLSVGFKFEHRCGHLTRSSSAPLFHETSPVFIQFLDCVWQIMHQFPREFEFNEKFLVELHRLTQSCEYGTFLKNCERERKFLKRKTASAWTYLFKRIEKGEFRNPLYRPPLTSEDFLKKSESSQEFKKDQVILRGESYQTSYESNTPDAADFSIDNLTAALATNTLDDPENPPFSTTSQDLKEPKEGSKEEILDSQLELDQQLALEGCLLPSTLPQRLKVFRALYCPNDFEPNGELRALTAKVSSILDEMELLKKQKEILKDVIDPSRVEQRRQEEETARKAKEARRLERRISAYDFDSISSLDDDTMASDD